MATLGQLFKTHLIKSVTRYCQDLAALSEEARSSSAGGSARTAYDFSYEVAVIFDRMGNRIQGLPTPPPEEGWTVAPPEFRNLESAISNLKSTAEALGTVFENLTEADFEREVQMGPTTWTVFDVVSMAINHTNYHDGQLCFIQSLSGDMEIHWA